MKLKCLKVPIEVSSGSRIKSIVVLVKVNRLMRFPINEEKSRSLDKSSNVLKALAI